MKGRFNLSRNRVRHFLGKTDYKREAEAPVVEEQKEVLQSSNDYRTFWLQPIDSSKMFTAVEGELPPAFGSGWIEVREVKKD